jgi:hypothetical protein
MMDGDDILVRIRRRTGDHGPGDGDRRSPQIENSRSGGGAGHRAPGRQGHGRGRVE